MTNYIIHAIIAIAGWETGRWLSRFFQKKLTDWWWRKMMLKTVEDIRRLTPDDDEPLGTAESVEDKGDHYEVKVTLKDEDRGTAALERHKRP